MRIDAEILREVSERAAQRVGRCYGVNAVEPNRPAAGLRHRRQHAHQRRFSRAVRAEEPENPRSQLERKIAHRMDGTIVLVEAIDLKLHGRMYGPRAPLCFFGAGFPCDTLASQTQPRTTEPVLRNRTGALSIRDPLHALVRPA